MSHDESLVKPHSATRRWVIGSGALLAGAGILSQAFAADAEPVGQGGDGGASQAAHAKIIEAAASCVMSCEVCLAHCSAALSRGDTSLKECMATVLATLPMCQTLVRFAAIDAPRLKELAKVCIDVCADCEKECDKHANHHEVCKDCAKACADCIKECKALLEA